MCATRTRRYRASVKRMAEYRETLEKPKFSRAAHRKSCSSTLLSTKEAVQLLSKALNSSIFERKLTTAQSWLRKNWRNAKAEQISSRRLGYRSIYGGEGNYRSYPKMCVPGTRLKELSTDVTTEIERDLGHHSRAQEQPDINDRVSLEKSPQRTSATSTGITKPLLSTAPMRSSYATQFPETSGDADDYLEEERVRNPIVMSLDAGPVMDESETLPVNVTGLSTLLRSFGYDLPKKVRKEVAFAQALVITDISRLTMIAKDVDAKVDTML